MKRVVFLTRSSPDSLKELDSELTKSSYGRYLATLPRQRSRSVSDQPSAPDLIGLDKLLEHRVRLAVCVLLSRVDALSFSRLKELLQETDGNLGANLRRLADADYLTVRREFIARKPVSWYALTDRGRDRLGEHVEALHRLTDSARLGPT